MSTLSSDFVRIAQEQTQAIWGGGLPLGERVESVLRELEEEGPERVRFAGLESGGRLACSLERFGLRLTGSLPAIGIGSIFTPEAHRGQGLATRLVREVMEEARGAGYGAALLFSDIEPAFYERLGFVRFPANRWTAGLTSLSCGGPLETREAEAGDGRLLDWYEKSLPAGLLRPERTPEIWRCFRRHNGSRSDLILSGGGADAGYLNVSIHGPRLWVNEWALREGVPIEGLWATIGWLGAQAGAETAAGWVRVGGLPPGAAVEARSMAIPMVAALDGRISPQLLDPALGHFDSLDHF